MLLLCIKSAAMGGVYQKFGEVWELSFLRYAREQTYGETEAPIAVFCSPTGGGGKYSSFGYRCTSISV